MIGFYSKIASMLQFLAINNIVLISSLELNFSGGLTVLTGETGAGKSILLDALALSLGVRGEKGLIRKGQTKATVTAGFDKSVNPLIKDILKEFDLELNDEEDLVLRRIITPDASKAYINDELVTAKLLNRIGNRLVEIHGQFENHGLMNRATHIEFLDKFAGNFTLLEKYRESYSAWKAKQEKLEEAKRNLAKIKEDEEYLIHCIKELDKLAPIKGEEEELSNRRKQLMSLEKNFELIKEAYQALNAQGRATENVRQCQNVLMRSLDESLNDLIDRLSTISDEIIAVNDDIESLLKMQTNPVEELELTEERLFSLRSLARKHQVSADDLQDLLEKLKEDLRLINKSDEVLFELEKEERATYKATLDIANQLHEKRLSSASIFEKEVMNEFAPLKLEKAKFKVEIIKNDELSSNGFDTVEFRVAMNSGMDFVPLDKTASGGELVRLMLALKVVLKIVNPIPIMVFDEVDTGISGATASAVGERLKKLGQNVQVIVITHSAQVAAQGNNHLKIEKYDENNETFTHVRPLTNEQRINEIARLISADEITPEAITMAQKLLI